MAARATFVSALRMPCADPDDPHKRHVATQALSPTCSVRTTWKGIGSHDQCHDRGIVEHAITVDRTTVYCETAEEVDSVFTSLQDVQVTDHGKVTVGESVKARASPLAWQVMQVNEVHIDGVVAHNSVSQRFLAHAEYGSTWCRTVETKPSAAEDDAGSSQHAGSVATMWAVPSNTLDWQAVIAQGAQHGDVRVSRAYECAIASIGTLATYLGLPRGAAVHTVQHMAWVARGKFVPHPLLLEKALLQFGPYVRNSWQSKREAEEQVWYKSDVGGRCGIVEQDVDALQSAMDTA